MVMVAAALGGRLWEPGMGCEQQRVGRYGSRGSDGGGGGVCKKRSTSSTRARGAQRAVVAVA